MQPHPHYRYLSPVDLDKFVSLSAEINVNSTITTIADNNKENNIVYHDTCDYNDDYGIMCDIPLFTFFKKENEDWMFVIDTDSSGGCCPCTRDDTSIRDALSLNENSIITTIRKETINAEELFKYNNAAEQSARFVHYRQCDNFFRHSFPLNAGKTTVVIDGDETHVKRIRLWAVYLCQTNGRALPPFGVMYDHGKMTDKVYYYAVLPFHDVSGNTFDDLTPYDLNGQQVYIICSHETNALHTHLQHIGTSKSNTFEHYKQDNDRMLFIYYIVDEEKQSRTGTKFTQSLHAAFRTHAQRPIRDNDETSWCCDKERMSIKLPDDLITNDDYKYFRLGHDLLFTPKLYHNFELSPRLSYPLSYFITEESSDGYTDYVPLAYEQLNTSYGVNASSIGYRILQLLSLKLFGTCADNEMAVAFPNLEKESSVLTDKIFNCVCTMIESDSYTRSEIIEHIVRQQGSTVFHEESSSFPNPTGTYPKYGLMKDILQQIQGDGVYLKFTVTLNTHLKPPNTDNVNDYVTIKHILVILHLYV